MLALNAVPARALQSQDAWKPGTRIGNFRFDLPGGWARRDTPNGPTLVPTDLAQGSVAYIALLAPQPISGNLGNWFDGTWAEWQRQFRVVDASSPTTARSADGFATERIYARISSPAFGFSVFVFGAVQVGSRVESYYFVSNADRYSYLNDLESFEASLRFSDPTPSASAGGAAGGLDGVYVGYRMRGATALEATHFEYLVFFPDGNALRYLPEEGLEHFDFQAALKTSRAYCGRYRVSANEIAITWGDNNSERAERSENAIKIGGDSYFPVSKANGLRLNGAYRREGEDLKSQAFRFSSDGRFLDNGMLQLVAYGGTDPSPGRGSYQIRDNTLTLRYDDGRTIALSFYVWPAETGEPRVIHVNTYRLVHGR